MLGGIDQLGSLLLASDDDDSNSNEAGDDVFGAVAVIVDADVVR